MRIVRLPLAIVAAAALAACSRAPTSIVPDQDAVDAANQFEALADSASRAGAEPAVFLGYREVGRAVRRNGRISPVTIVVDGMPIAFLATAQQVELDAGPECRQPGSLCQLVPPLRSVVAWQRSAPRRVAQLIASAGTAEIGRMMPGTLTGTFMRTATLTYFDGAGGVYVGTSGTQTISEPVTTDTPCHSMPVSPGAMTPPELVRCTRAEFTASFSGSVAPPAFVMRNNTASGAHTLAMAPQSIHGSRLVLDPGSMSLCADCAGGYPREVLPPIDLQGGALTATLTTSATTADVTVTLRITNGLAGPTTIQFVSGQHFDLRVRRLDGTPIWTWSADRSFTAALESRTLAAGESLTFTVKWAPTERGNLVAEGWLTSSTHRALATSPFTVP